VDGCGRTVMKLARTSESQCVYPYAFGGAKPYVYFDAIVVKVRQNGRVINKAIHLALGVNLAGRKELLGLWMTQNEYTAFTTVLLISMPFQKSLRRQNIDSLKRVKFQQIIVTTDNARSTAADSKLQKLVILWVAAIDDGNEVMTCPKSKAKSNACLGIDLGRSSALTITLVSIT